ncbi:hypothetical protein E8E11_002488 [Didymella keratinophila]|nr:hypothetical protein E8E11_002488 [Didymella keratinophila]
MSGKTCAWIRKKLTKLRRLCRKKKPVTCAEDTPLVLILSLSELSPEPQSARTCSDDRSSVTSPVALPRPLRLPYSGAYPTPYPSPRPDSVASSRPESIAPLRPEHVAPKKRRLGRMQKPPGRRPPPEFQHLNDVPEVKQRAIRQQTSALSTNTIGWNTPIGDYAGGKQVYLHPTGLCELRRPESAARIQEMEAVANCDFRASDTLVQVRKKSPVTLPSDILVEILERTSPATLIFSCRLVSRMFRSWSEHFLRKKLEYARVVTTAYNGKSRRPCALKTALHVLTGRKTRRFSNHVTNTPDAYIAFERGTR